MNIELFRHLKTIVGCAAVSWIAYCFALTDPELAKNAVTIGFLSFFGLILIWFNPDLR